MERERGQRSCSRNGGRDSRLEGMGEKQEIRKYKRERNKRKRRWKERRKYRKIF